MEILVSPALILPVFRGGVYFQECLDSLLPCMSCFSEIIISINGKNGKADLVEVNSRLSASNVHILQTNQELSPLNHHYFIANYIKKHMSLKRDMFLLCHDDLLCSDEIIKASQSPGWEYQENCICIGDYNLFGDLSVNNFGSAFIGLRHKNLRCTVNEWYESLDSKMRCFTSISGMRMKSNVYVETIEFLLQTKMKKGFRMEYALIAHRSNQYIARYPQPLVNIRCHPAQEGRALANIDRSLDEARFCLWYYINSKDFQTFLIRAKGGLGLSHFIRHLLLALFFLFKSHLNLQ